MTTEEQCVKVRYPDAKCIGVGVPANGPIAMYMIIGCQLGENYASTQDIAWANAYTSIQKKDHQIDNMPSTGSMMGGDY